jgi:hypothetical protein
VRLEGRRESERERKRERDELERVLRERIMAGQIIRSD